MGADLLFRPLLAAGAPAPTLARIADEVQFLVLGGGMLLVALLAVLHTIRKVTETRAKEQTRREVAAYVAEGSITPDDATRMLSAGMSESVATELAKGVTWGTISAEKARKMVQALQQPPAAPKRE